jgi:hypothetical protein
MDGFIYGVIINMSYQQELKRITYKLRDTQNMYHLKLYKNCDSYNKYCIIRNNIHYYDYYKIIYDKEGKIISMEPVEVDCKCIII